MTTTGDQSHDGPPVTVLPVTEARWEDLVALWSDSNGCDGCWCFNHHIERGTPDVRGDAAREAKHRHVAARRASGVIAYVDGVPSGWCAVDVARDLGGHDCVRLVPGAADAGTWFIHCFYVNPAARRRGVARAMLRETLAWLRGRGARRVEAFPSPPDEPPLFHAFGGPFELFAQEGFRRTDDAMGEGYCRVVREL